MTWLQRIEFEIDWLNDPGPVVAAIGDIDTLVDETPQSEVYVWTPTRVYWPIPDSGLVGSAKRQ